MNEMFKVMLDCMPFPVWIKDLDLKFRFLNKKYIERFEGKSKEDFLGKTNEDVFDPELSKIHDSYCSEAIEKRQVIIADLYIGYIYKQCTIIPLINEENNLIGVAGVVSVISEQGILKEKDSELEMQKNLTRQIIDLLPGVVFYKDRDSRYVYANKACREFYEEKGIDSIYGKSDAEINPDTKLSHKFLEDDKRILENGETIHNEAVFQLENGVKQYREVVKMPLIDDMGNVLGIVGRSIDVTKQREAEERLKYLSYIDILTGAKNRTSFEERVKELDADENLPIGLIMGDANGLKLVNDTIGHQEGDKLLKYVAEIMTESCEGRGDVYRIGGDEFVILLPGADQKVCEEVMMEISYRCKSYDYDLFTVSIALGASVKNHMNKSIFTVFKEAEDKVYRQKLLQEKSRKR